MYRYQFNTRKLTWQSKRKPNPETLGWTYTGCNVNSRVMFYERDGVKMDYFHTTGTVKISLDHPQEGLTQWFQKHLDAQQFEQVCKDPLEHTRKGYQTTKPATWE